MNAQCQFNVAESRMKKTVCMPRFIGPVEMSVATLTPPSSTRLSAALAWKQVTASLVADPLHLHNTLHF